MSFISWVKDLFKKNTVTPEVLPMTLAEIASVLDIPEQQTPEYSEKDQAIKKALMARLDCGNTQGFQEMLKKFPVKDEMLADRDLINMMWKIIDEQSDDSLYKGRDTYQIKFIRCFKVSQEEINQHVRDLVTKRIKDHPYYISSQTIDFLDRLSTDKSLKESPEVRAVIKKCFDPRFEEFAPWVVILKTFKFDAAERSKILTGLLEHYAYDDDNEFRDFESIFTAFGGMSVESIDTIVNLYMVLITRGYDEGVQRLDERLLITEKFGDDENFIKRQKEAAMKSLKHSTHIKGVAKMKDVVKRYGLLGNEVPLADTMLTIKNFFLNGEPSEAFFLGQFVGLSEEELQKMAYQSYKEIEPGPYWGEVVNNLHIYVPEKEIITEVRRLYLGGISGNGRGGPWLAMEMAKKFNLPDEFINSKEALAAANEGYLRFLTWDNGNAEAILKMYPSVG